METKICKHCGAEKYTNLYGYNHDTCMNCVQQRQRIYEDLGWGMPEELKTNIIRSNIFSSQQILSSMGYDIDKSIHEQFKVRIYEKYGVKFSG